MDRHDVRRGGASRIRLRERSNQPGAGANPPATAHIAIDVEREEPFTCARPLHDASGAGQAAAEAAATFQLERQRTGDTGAGSAFGELPTSIQTMIDQLLAQADDCAATRLAPGDQADTSSAAGPGASAADLAFVRRFDALVDSTAAECGAEAVALVQKDAFLFRSVLLRDSLYQMSSSDAFIGQAIQQLLGELMSVRTAARRLSAEETAELQAVFAQERYPSDETKLNLAQRLNLTKRQIDVWFANRRERAK